VKKKKELQRIDQENIKMMNRIVNQGSILSTKKMEMEYKKKQKLLKNLQRNNIAPVKQLLKKQN